MSEYPKPQEVSVPFSVVLDRDEDGVYVAACPALPGCVSQGASEAEALENLTEAIQGCLEVRLQGWTAPEEEVSDEELTEAWNEELTRRSREVASGEVELASWGDLRRDAREALSQRRTILRRVEELRSGKVKAIPLDEAVAMVRAGLRSERVAGILEELWDNETDADDDE